MNQTDPERKSAVRRGMRWKMMVAMAAMIVAIVAMLTILNIGNQKAGLEKHLETYSDFLKAQMNRNADRLSARMSEHFEKLIATHRLPLAGEYVREMVRDIDDLRYVILMQEGEPRL
ncbi:MAG: hybrid sensor histidine kinase/response regulator, partial [Mariprofundus sp.]